MKIIDKNCTRYKYLYKIKNEGQTQDQQIITLQTTTTTTKWDYYSQNCGPCLAMKVCSMHTFLKNLFFQCTQFDCIYSIYTMFHFLAIAQTQESWVTQTPTQNDLK